LAKEKHYTIRNILKVKETFVLRSFSEGEIFRSSAKSEGGTFAMPTKSQLQPKRNTKNRRHLFHHTVILSL
jgi:hypothetical protein